MGRICLVLLLATASAANVARCDVIVLANRTGIAVAAQFEPMAGQPEQIKLQAGEVMPLFLDGKAHVSFGQRGDVKRYLLDANCAYYFGRGKDGRFDLEKIGLGEDGFGAGGRPLPGSASSAPVATIAVKILVDEEEAGRQPVWEHRLRRRFEAASAILQRHCQVAFQVVAVGTWKSDNSITDFTEALTEFEHKVSPLPAQIAVGFTSQWNMPRGRIHIAGTRGPLHSHILVHEGPPNISEPERLEFLVHELGHFLGATHSPERNSVMRPVLGDKQAGRNDFHIQFDPVNTLIISMVGEEIRRRSITRFSNATDGTLHRLRQIYGELARAMPNDPSAGWFVQATTPKITAPPTTSRKLGGAP